MRSPWLSLAVQVAISLAPVSSNADELAHDAQVALKALGYLKSGVDGSFGPKSLTALRSFCADHNLPDDGKLDVHDLINLQDIAKEEVKIPLLLSHSEKPNGSGLTNTDIKSYDYTQCSASFRFKIMDRAERLSGIEYIFKGFFEADLYPTYIKSEKEQSEERFTVDLADTIFNLNHHCLTLDKNACQTIIDLASLMEDKGSYVLTVDPNQRQHGAEVYFRTKQRILTPLLLAYSTAVQVLGRPENHEKIGRWAYSAILQNTFDPFALPNRIKANRDFFRDDTPKPQPEAPTLCPDLRATSHSLKAGLLAGIYGAIWQDEHMFQLAFDVLEPSLEGIDENGAIPCSAIRGANALFYSGGDLNAILTIIQIAKLNGVGLENIKNIDRVHLAAEFILNSAIDDSILEKYAKTNFLAWCGDDYRRQCIDEMYGRIAAFGWIPLYRHLFPSGAASKHFEALAHEMETSDKIEDERKWALTAILRSNHPVDLIQHNFANVPLRPWDNVAVIYTDVIETNMGSPYCLYKYSDRTR